MRTPPTVHPRVCGEASFVVPGRVAHPGPSPRVRGSLEARIRLEVDEGSIPACAGKPRSYARTGRGSEVHPRVCGEAVRARTGPDRVTGPSPRVRGSPAAPVQSASATGSIPACAGKPRTASPKPTSPRVHPRVCGEAAEKRIRDDAPLGPSPRVRGSLRRREVEHDLKGSIPACAGKPAGSWS